MKNNVIKNDVDKKNPFEERFVLRKTWQMFFVSDVILYHRNVQYVRANAIQIFHDII